ncbi:MAG: prolipoprotein diacylglyceryl transferase [Oscillospiraceae bacterium]|jgi:phosphatidylglycerol:prolipoprotein diacylglycerol transferase|nr:prolipoprotein diacylglyceryl transferase [Oscillospiraceae bacterium]
METNDIIIFGLRLKISRVAFTIPQLGWWVLLIATALAILCAVGMFGWERFIKRRELNVKNFLAQAGTAAAMFFTVALIYIIFTRQNPDGWNVYWYGIIIALGFMLALVYGFKNAARLGVDRDRLTDAVLIAAVFGLLGARLYYILFDGAGGLTLRDFFAFHEGGLAIYGGIIFAFASAAVMCKVRKIDLFSLFDLAAIGFSIGQAVGRWGNFFNQEAYGGPTQSTWWGMTSTQTQYDTGSDTLVHPCFLYESLWCGLGILLLHFYSKRRKFKGEIFLAYAVWYGFGRFWIEGLRTDSLMIGSAVKVSQLVSALVFLAGITVIAFMRARPALTARKQAKAAAEAAEYAPLFDSPEDEFEGSGEDLEDGE